SGSNNTFINVDFGAVNFTISGNNNRFINCQHTGTRTDNGTGNVWDASPATSDATIAKLRFDNANRLVTAGGRGAMIGSDPGFLFDVSVAAAEGKVLSAEEPDVTDTPVLDATKRESYYATVMSLGTQWQLTATTLQDDPNGINPAIEYESEDTDVATVDPDGLVRYVADGQVVIACTSAETAASPARRNERKLVNSSSSEVGYTVTEYIPDAVVPADHVLVIFNADNADSVEIKNYYLANRPGMSGAQTLGITGCPATEYVEDGLFDSTVRAQVASYLGADSIIRYIVVCRGIPTRLTEDGGDRYYFNGEVCSAAYRLAYCLHDLGVRTGSDYTDATARMSVGQYQRMAGLVTHLDMGSKAATLAYIDKLAAMGAEDGALDADGVTISASAASLGGSRWVLDGEATYGGGMVSDRNAALLAEGVSSEDITLRNDGEGNVTSAADVTYYQSWGVHTIWTGDYTIDGSVTFSGQSNWYLIETIESFNGVLTSSHGTYADWFSATAFGGTGYSNTPAGAVAHTAEPGASLGANDEYYAALWARGWNFAECAWQSRRMRHFIAVGDPLVRR
ncbi:MAG: Ig-like domain-containing protein, partial [Planctomycetota bacterium]